MSDDGEIDYPLPPEEDVGADDAQRAADDVQRAEDDAQRAEEVAEAARRVSRVRRANLVPPLEGGLERAAEGLDAGGSEEAAEEARIPPETESYFGEEVTAAP